METQQIAGFPCVECTRRYECNGKKECFISTPKCITDKRVKLYKKIYEICRANCISGIAKVRLLLIDEVGEELQQSLVSEFNKEFNRRFGE